MQRRAASRVLEFTFIYGPRDRSKHLAHQTKTTRRQKGVGLCYDERRMGGESLFDCSVRNQVYVKQSMLESHKLVKRLNFYYNVNVK